MQRRVGLFTLTALVATGACGSGSGDDAAGTAANSATTATSVVGSDFCDAWNAADGLQMSEAEFEAFRFFTIGVGRGEVAGRDAHIGNAWHDDGGPAVVTTNGLHSWRQRIAVRRPDLRL